MGFWDQFWYFFWGFFTALNLFSIYHDSQKRKWQDKIANAERELLQFKLKLR